jgi:hypothetical protein
MKFIFFLLLPCLTQLSNAQKVQLPVDSINHKITYYEAVQADNINSAMLYNNAKLFIDNKLTSKESILRKFDTNSKKVTARGSLIYYNAGGSINITYNLFIQSNDNAYMYSFSDFLMSDWPSQYAGYVPGGDFDTDNAGEIPKRKWEKIKSYVDKEIKKRIELLKKTMSDKSE